jgi:hypothetical protein
MTVPYTNYRTLLLIWLFLWSWTCIYLMSDSMQRDHFRRGILVLAWTPSLTPLTPSWWIFCCFVFPILFAVAYILRLSVGILFGCSVSRFFFNTQKNTYAVFCLRVVFPSTSISRLRSEDVQRTCVIILSRTKILTYTMKIVYLDICMWF